MADKTKIDWCDASWNPVTGCRHGCKYCYARNIATRFSGYNHSDFCDAVDFDGKKAEIKSPLSITLKNGKTIRAAYPFGFAPTLHRYMLEPGNDGELPAPQAWQRPRTIFVCSMADLFGDWVPDEWITEVFEACGEAGRHRYLFLTKNPKRYMQLYEKGLLPAWDFMWYGTSVTTSDTEYFFSGIHNTFASIEPILTDFDPRKDLLCKWAIIGAETGLRKDKVTPQRAWIDHVTQACDRCGIPVFMKSSLREMMGPDFRTEYPWEANP